MSNPEHSAYVLNALRALGLRLALDDFGTGHSSLSYLHRFPFDTIKIPATFVQLSDDGGIAHTQVPIIRAIVTLASELDLAVIAEGVETHRGNRAPAAAQLPVRPGLCLRRGDDRAGTGQAAAEPVQRQPVTRLSAVPGGRAQRGPGDPEAAPAPRRSAPRSAGRTATRARTARSASRCPGFPARAGPGSSRNSRARTAPRAASRLKAMALRISSVAVRQISSLTS